MDLWAVATFLLYVVLLLRQAEPFARYNGIRVAGLLLFFLPIPPIVAYLLNALLIDNLDCRLFPGRVAGGLGKKCEDPRYQSSDKLYDAAVRTLALITFPHRRDALLYGLYAVRTLADLYVAEGGSHERLLFVPNLFEVYYLAKYLRPEKPLGLFAVGTALKLLQEKIIHG
jgi:hypothetical protein